MTKLEALRQSLSTLDESEVYEVLKHLQQKVYIPCIVSKADMEKILDKQLSETDFTDILKNDTVTKKICGIVEYTLDVCYAENDKN